MDGSELTAELSEEATVRQACLEIARLRGVPSYQVKLVVQGQYVVLRSVDRLLDATEVLRELLVVASRGPILGEGHAVECSVVDASFEHFKVEAILDGARELVPLAKPLCRAMRS